jgi:hypothetical protein
MMNQPIEAHSLMMKMIQIINKVSLTRKENILKSFSLQILRLNSKRTTLKTIVIKILKDFIKKNALKKD